MSRTVSTSKACEFDVIDYGLTFKGCRCGTGILDAAVFTGMREMEMEEVKLAPEGCSPLHAAIQWRNWG